MTSLPRSSRTPFARSDVSPRGRPADFLFKALFAQATWAAGPKYGGPTATEIAERIWGDDAEPAIRLLTKGTTAPASTATSHWASELSPSAVVGDFISSLAPMSAAARLIGAGARASLDGINTIAYPVRQGGKASATVSWAGQGAPIAVKQRALDVITLGPACKLASIVGLSEELVRQTANGQAALTQLLREDVAISLDAALFSTAAAVANTSPSGLLYGLSAVTASSKTTVLEAMREDLQNLAGAICDAGGNSEQIAFICSPRQAAAIRIWLGQDRAPPTVWPCSALANKTIVCMQTDGFCSAFGSEPEISASNAAVLHMEDTTPLPIRDGTTASPVRSMYQTDMIAVRLVLDAAWVMRASGLVSYMTAASWGGGT